VKPTTLFFRLVVWSWLAAMLLAGSASAAYVCPKDMGAASASALRADCADNDQPALCATYLRGSSANTPEAPPPAGGEPSRPLSIAPSSPFGDVAAWRPTQQIASSGSAIPVYLATARLRH
jgi:hypothetical protein